MVTDHAAVSVQTAVHLGARSAVALLTQTNERTNTRRVVNTLTMNTVRPKLHSEVSVPQATVMPTNQRAPIVALHHANQRRDPPQHQRPCHYATAFKLNAPLRLCLILKSFISLHPAPPALKRRSRLNSVR